MEKLSSDRDSLVALESLLRIGAAKANPEGNTNTGMATAADAILNQHRYATAPTPTGTHAAGAPPITPAMAANILPPSLGAAAGLLLRHHQHAPPAQGFSQSQLAVAQRALAAAATFRQMTAAAAASGSNPQQHQLASPSGSSTKSSSSKSPPTTSSTPEQQDIRKEKVEEALRSKPQRGKKRDDLSDKERLELTRSRNREHAKTTRIRKKARYQELLDCETRLKDFSQSEQLKNERCLVLQKFLQLRESMVRTVTANSNDTTNMENYPSPENASSILKELVVGNNSTNKNKQTLEEFKIHIITPTNQETANGCGDCVSKLMSWDRAVVNKITQTYGVGAENLLVYQLVGGTDGIAISNNGIAHAKVNLTMHFNDHNEVLVLSGFLTTSFGANNDHRLASVEWTTVRDHCQGLPPTRGGAASTASLPATSLARGHPSNMLLQSQSVYPSVVSLDHPLGGIGSQEPSPPRPTDSTTEVAKSSSSRSSTPTREELSF